MHLIVLFLYFYLKIENILYFWEMGFFRVVGSWTTWFLDFNKRGAWNKRGAGKFVSFLINLVADITELWV